MNKKLLLGLFVALTVTINGSCSRNGNVIDDQVVTRSYEPVLGLYDRSRYLTAAPASIVHVAITLGRSKQWTLTNHSLSDISRDQPVLVTLEMWGSKTYNRKNYRVLQQIADGEYDAKLSALCEQLLKNHSEVYLRWNPEMEVPVDRYPWQNLTPVYMVAFRRVRTLCAEHAPQVRMLWGPAGYPGALEFWPGSEYVDLVSITLKGESELLSDAYPHEEDVEVLLKRKLHRLRFIDKPILILGSKKVPDSIFRSEWLEHAIATIERDSIVYGFAKQAPGINGSKRRSDLKLGLYDPTEALVDQDAVSVEHLFADFATISDGEFKAAFEKVISRRHDVIVTVEPMQRPPEPLDQNVLRNILSGDYDDLFEQVYQIVADAGQTVYLRFAHEMEIPVTRYPWQSQDPVEYIHAFRYFMNFQNEPAANIIRVWGPAGDRGSLEFWPGDDVVDLISVAIYGLPDKNITDPSKQESFKTIFNRKYKRMRFVDKPIFITEFGVKGPEDYQTRWLEAAAKTILEHPQIVGVSYFNMVDSPKAWGDIKAPDWSITEASLDRFTSLLGLH